MSQPELDVLTQAQEYLRSKQLPRAQRLLVEYIKKNPNSEQAWLLLSTAVDDPRKQIECLQRVLRINPVNKEAQDRLMKAMAAQTAPPEPRAVSATTPAVVSQPPPGEPAPFTPPPIEKPVPISEPRTPEPAPVPVQWQYYPATEHWRLIAPRLSNDVLALRNQDLLPGRFAGWDGWTIRWNYSGARGPRQDQL